MYGNGLQNQLNKVLHSGETPKLHTRHCLYLETAKSSMTQHVKGTEIMPGTTFLERTTQEKVKNSLE